jgi:tRNA(fMet)-specific endonuclease VapC
MGDLRYLLDLLIAVHTLALDLILVTDNVDDFARVPGLAIENWLAA